MTNRDRESVADLLRKVSARLRAAPIDTADAAARHEKEFPGGRGFFQAGALEQVCKQEATAIDAYIAAYLTPKTTAKRGRR